MLAEFVVAAAMIGGNPPNAFPVTVRRTEVIGYSQFGRPIRAVVLDGPAWGRNVLVVGCIHGNEPSGIAIARRLSRRLAPPEADIWIVDDLNPDGHRLGVRQNGRGVDLNRNFSAGWRPLGERWDPTYSGPRPFSERESRVAARLILRISPSLTIWYHQPQTNVRAVGENVSAARRYARLVGLPFRRLPVPPGAATRWQNARFPGRPAFVVELPPGPVSTQAAIRHTRAVVTLARSP
jgi:murein peptide amidase A